jgi:hypothetical protein
MYADKKIYRGHWMDDLYHGVGILRTPSGASYNGMWRHGQQEGQGELRYADGSLYFGDFSKNLQEGEGGRKGGGIVDHCMSQTLICERTVLCTANLLPIKQQRLITAYVCVYCSL